MANNRLNRMQIRYDHMGYMTTDDLYDVLLPGELAFLDNDWSKGSDMVARPADDVAPRCLKIGTNYNKISNVSLGCISGIDMRNSYVPSIIDLENITTTTVYDYADNEYKVINEWCYDSYNMGLLMPPTKSRYFYQLAFNVNVYFELHIPGYSASYCEIPYHIYDAFSSQNLDNVESNFNLYNITNANITDPTKLSITFIPEFVDEGKKFAYIKFRLSIGQNNSDFYNSTTKKYTFPKGSWMKVIVS